MSPAWVENWLGLIFQVYGLAFFVMGIVALLSRRGDTRNGLSEHLGWLAAFGILHGLQEFVDGERLQNPAPWLGVLSAILMVSSFVALLEFGRRIWNEGTGTFRLNAILLFPAITAAILVILLVVGEPIAGVELGARYLLGGPGAALTAIGLLGHSRVTAQWPDARALVGWRRPTPFWLTQC